MSSLLLSLIQTEIALITCSMGVFVYQAKLTAPLQPNQPLQTATVERIVVDIIMYMAHGFVAWLLIQNIQHHETVNAAILSLWINGIILGSYLAVRIYETVKAFRQKH